MKSISLLMTLMILLTAFGLSAQTTIGINAGAAFSNVTLKAGPVSASLESKTGITAGITLDAPLSSNFSFQPALNFVQKGYRLKDESSKETVNLNYLEVPLNFVYSTEKNYGFFIGAGPSLAYGISGKDKFSSEGMPDDEEKIKFGSSPDDVKAFDFGLNALAGYRTKGAFTISANYNLGLSKLNNSESSDDKSSIKNKYFGVKIGYRLGQAKSK